uniref:Uncharacterized protein n=1 Tax=Arundo donax TaxID=35708 RepID=A0A0A9HA04_ARUDO
MAGQSRGPGSLVSMLEHDRLSFADASTTASPAITLVSGAAPASPFSAPSPRDPTDILFSLEWKSNSKSDRSPPFTAAFSPSGSPFRAATGTVSAETLTSRGATLSPHSPTPAATGASMNSTGFNSGQSLPSTFLASATLPCFFFLPASRAGKQLILAITSKLSLALEFTVGIRRRARGAALSRCLRETPFAATTRRS